MPPDLGYHVQGSREEGATVIIEDFWNADRAFDLLIGHPPTKTGDAIFFTEALRHGGLTNRSEQVRKTLHVGYGPHFLMSQNIATMDELPYLTDTTRARLTSAQLDLFRPYPGR